MKFRLALASLLAVVAAFCTSLPRPVNLPGVITLYAQALPVTKTLVWTPQGAAADSYTVKMDGTTIGSPTTPSQAVVFTTNGTHVLTVTATNIWGTSAPATLTVNVAAPSAPNGLGIQ